MPDACREIYHTVILIRGAGEMATGIAYRLHVAGYKVCLTEIPYPLAVSRANTFSDAVFDGEKTVCGVTTDRVVPAVPEIESVWENGRIPLVIDANAEIRKMLHPDIMIDAIMAKKPTGTEINHASLVIGIGPGFYAGRDVHIVIETNDSNGNLGRVIREGEAEPDTGVPVETGGATFVRVIWAPEDGVFTSKLEIGDTVKKGQTTGFVNKIPLIAGISGKLRGIIRNGTRVPEGAKLIEIDPVNDENVFYLIRGKIWNVAGAVVNALCLEPYRTKPYSGKLTVKD